MSNAENNATTGPRHWGCWIMERAKLLGIATGEELATSINITRRQMCRWRTFATPPRLSGGNDLQLARALRIDLEMLFNGYRSTAPADAGVVDSPSPLANPMDALRREVHALIDLLHADELHDVRGMLQKSLREYLADAEAEAQEQGA